MTATARVDNVIHVQFPQLLVAAGGGAVESPGETTAATRPIPARWSPRPLAVAHRRFAASQLRADLADWTFYVAVLTSTLAVLYVIDHIRSALS